MTKKEKKNGKGDTFEWEETPELKEALKKLHVAYGDFNAKHNCGDAGDLDYMSK